MSDVVCWRQSYPVLLIGEAPGAARAIPSDWGAGPDLSPTLLGFVGHRLAEYAGLTQAEYLELTERHNLLPIYPGPTWWPAREAAEAAQSIWPSMLGRRTILLGRRVAAAFGIRGPDFEWMTVEDDTALAVMPHPSGRNLWWNEPENRARARRFLRAAFERNDE